MTYRIGNSVIGVITGDICGSKCDVIVSSDDSRLSQGGGVSLAIARAGGDDIHRQISNLTPVDLGDVAVTTAGKLPQKYIFHAVTIDLEKAHVIDDGLQDFIVRNSVRRCFQLMSVLKLSSIAFPIVGAGVAGVSPDRACRRMAEVFVEELGRMNRGLMVELWTFGTSTDLADSVFCDIIGTNRKNAGLLSSAWIDNSSSGIMNAVGITGAAVTTGVAVAASDVGLGSFMPAITIGGAFIKYLTGKAKSRNVRDLSVSEPNSEKSDCPDGDISREVFISYSRDDSNDAEWVCKVLRAAGISYWRDVDGTYSGQNYKGVIARAIRAAHTVMFLSSKNSNASENVVGEIGAALHYRKCIVPVKLDAAEYHDNLLMDMLYLDNIDCNFLGRDKAGEKICKVVLLNRANYGVKNCR